MLVSVIRFVEKFAVVFVESVSIFELFDELCALEHPCLSVLQLTNCPESIV